jgi:type IV pilus assembly protein PilY1
MLLSLYLAAPAYAFTPSDSPLLSAAAVAPNVMLLIDDSGSMNSIIYAAGIRSDGQSRADCDGSATPRASAGLNLDSDTGDIFLVEPANIGCSGGAYAFYNNSPDADLPETARPGRQW